MNKPPFIDTVFDLSFDRFVVVRIVRLFFGLAILASAAVLIGMVYRGLVGYTVAQTYIDALAATDAPAAQLDAEIAKRTMSIMVLVLAPFASAGFLLLSRIVSEMVVVLFTIAERLPLNDETNP